VPQKYAVVGNVQPIPQQLQPLTQPPVPIPTPQVMSHTVRLMPTPDKAYYAELFGDIRPEPLSPENPETYLTVFYPELFLCACMVFGSGYQRDFGAQSDDPARAVSWEGQYNYLRQSIAGEVLRMRGTAPPAPAPA
jgi:hypothetical protein